MKNLIPLSLLGMIALATSTGSASESSQAMFFNYFTPVIKVEACQNEASFSMLSTSGKTYSMCISQYEACRTEGNCLLDNNGQNLLATYSRYDKTIQRSLFKIEENPKCQFGTGSGSISKSTAGTACLIPYHSIAADPLQFNLGDVLLIEELKGAQMPDGTIHDGYVIVSDYAKEIVDSAVNNFGFFTGTKEITEINSLHNLGLTNFDKVFSFIKVDSGLARKIQAKKGFKIIETYKKTFVTSENLQLKASGK